MRGESRGHRPYDHVRIDRVPNLQIPICERLLAGRREMKSQRAKRNLEPERTRDRYRFSPPFPVKPSTESTIVFSRVFFFFFFRAVKPLEKFRPTVRERRRFSLFPDCRENCNRRTRRRVSHNRNPIPRIVFSLSSPRVIVDVSQAFRAECRANACLTRYIIVRARFLSRK